MRTRKSPPLYTLFCLTAVKTQDQVSLLRQASIVENQNEAEMRDLSLVTSQICLKNMISKLKRTKNL